MANNGFARRSRDGTLLRLRVSPGAKRSSLEGLYGEDTLRLKVAAPPVDGKANAETERFLAELFGLSRSEVSVEKGAASRDKVVLVRGLEPPEVSEVLRRRAGCP